MSDDATIIAAVREAAHPFQADNSHHAALLDYLGDKEIVCLGESTHGTHEHYRMRAEITRRLIEERGFDAVIVEADWPDAYRVNRFVRGGDEDDHGLAALASFQRFPVWMWRNADVLDFVAWLRGHNEAVEPWARTGFYGMDLYSLHRSIDAVLRYLESVDREAAVRARERYACFEHAERDGAAYGLAAIRGFMESCEDVAVEQLLDMNRHLPAYAGRDGQRDPDDHFQAQQNARLVKNAEEYYRAMYRGRVASWNLRDQHMMETIVALRAHLAQRKEAVPRLVVWAHNSHLGDASATELAVHGELNVGQLVREKYGPKAALVGFSTYTGTVTAASGWDEPPQRMAVTPALPESYEAIFHEVGAQAFVLPLLGDRVRAALAAPRLQRAIGVVYRPDTERASHYYRVSLPRQFDVMIHFDQSRAVEPIDRSAGWRIEALPETFPTGL